MNYYLGRDGQKLGPYPLVELQNMQAEGQIRPTDFVWTEGMANWVPASQVLGAIVPAPPPPFGGVYQQPAAGSLSNQYPTPPSMHWALVLLLGFITCGIFSYVWMFIQASFVKKLDPKNNTILMYILYLVLALGGTFLSAFGAALLSMGTRDVGMNAMFGYLGYIPGVVCFIIGNFSMRDSLEAHYNRVEPIGLRLSGVMTFFFHILYFQYHFTRIAEMKRTGIITAQ